MALETGGDLTASQAKEVLGVLVASGGDPAAVAADLGFEAMDTSELESMVDQLIADNAEAWSELLESEGKARKKKMGFFTGEIMKATRGQADGKVVNQLLAARAGS